MTAYWRLVFNNWDRYLLPDLMQFFRIDLYDDATLNRSWRWLHQFVMALLDIPDSRLARSMKNQ